MTDCVCGHPANLHGPVCILRYGGCGCHQYEADDGTPSHLGNVVIETYSGRYKGPWSLGESA